MMSNYGYKKKSVPVIFEPSCINTCKEDTVQNQAESRVCKKCSASQKAKSLVVEDNIRTLFRFKHCIQWSKINAAVVISILNKYVSKIQRYSYNFVMSRHITLPIIIIIRHQSVLDSPVSPSSNIHFQDLPSRLRPFGLQFSTVFAILLLFILVACRSQFDLYLLRFSSTGSTFQISKIYSFLFGKKSCNILFS